jgi:thiosulfate sulfurtransferase
MNIPEISAEDAAALLDGGVPLFLDVRDPGSFASAHIPGAVHGSDANIQDFVDDTDKAQKIIVYCYHGNTSMGGTAYLLDQGFSDVSSMSGGFEAWRGRFPEERG